MNVRNDILCALNAKSILRIVLTAWLIVLGVGCKSSPESLLKLSHDDKVVAEYAFRYMAWRESVNVPGAVETVGYGLVPFINNSMSPDYNPLWPPNGFVSYWLHVVPETKTRYALKFLGPAAALGPGDDEVLTGTIENPTVTSSAAGERTITFNDVNIHSRNFPNKPFKMSGTILANTAKENEFDEKVREFNQQLGYRGPVIPR